MFFEQKIDEKKFRGLIKGITSECHLFSFYNWQKYSPFSWSPRMVWRGVTIPDFLRFSRYKNSSLSTNKHLIVLCAGCGQVDTLYSEIRYHNNTYIIKLKRKEYQKMFSCLVLSGGSLHLFRRQSSHQEEAYVSEVYTCNNVH